jgi:hypothetical protein
MSDVIKATKAIIDLIKPSIKADVNESARIVYSTLGAVMDYPNVELVDKLSIINGVAKYLINNYGADSPITFAALTVSVENNDSLN